MSSRLLCCPLFTDNSSLSSISKSAKPDNFRNMAAREESQRTGREARLLARDNKLSGSNTGIATGVYCNLAVIPKKHASDFRQLCYRNPVSLPLLEAMEAGQHASKLAKDSDVSTDVALYNVYEDGKLSKKGIYNISAGWTSDHVGFLLGCSFTFEMALVSAGLKPRNLAEGKTPPVYVTTVPLSPSGAFQGGYVVASMRWYHPEDVETVRAVTRRLPRQHGEPIAWGWEGADMLGVREKIIQHKVDFGQWSEPEEDEVPVFWGCGVTAELAIQAAKLPGISFTHCPG